MEKRSGIKKLLSIFDLNIYKALNLEEGITTRVIFRYDKETNRSEFKVLNKGMSREMSHRIESWLADNIRDYNEIANLNTGIMNADNRLNNLTY